MALDGLLTILSLFATGAPDLDNGNHEQTYLPALPTLSYTCFFLKKCPNIFWAIV